MQSFNSSPSQASMSIAMSRNSSFLSEASSSASFWSAGRSISPVSSTSWTNSDAYSTPANYSSSDDESALAWALAAMTALNRVAYNLSPLFLPTRSSTSMECAKCGTHFFGQNVEEVQRLICPKDGHPHYIDDQDFWSLPHLDAGRTMVALDCEMVLTSRGSELAQIVVIDENGQQLALLNVRPKGVITDLLTKFSGIRSVEELTGPNSIEFEELPYQLADLRITANTYVVGHGLESDFKAMRLFHKNVIDSAILFHHAELGVKRQKLSTLTALHLGRSIQQVAHDPSEDAIAALDLVKLYLHQVFDMDTLYRGAFLAKLDLNLPARQHPRQVATRAPKNFVRNEERMCHQCGHVGHMKSSCPARKGKRQWPGGTKSSGTTGQSDSSKKILRKSPNSTRSGSQ